MVHRALKGCNIVAIGNYYEKHTPEQIKRWVEEASGKIFFQSKITAKTTHLLVSDKKWKEQGAVIKEALQRKESGHNIHIVTWDWLDNSVKSKTRRAESQFSWLKKARSAVKTKDGKEPRSTEGLMAQVFNESTDRYLTESAKKLIAKRQRVEEEARIEEEERKQKEIDEDRERKNIKALVDYFERGIQKSRNELLKDKYHIYVDEMGFTYDAILEPVAQSEIPDERHTVHLQLWESNDSNDSKSETDKPTTYAFIGHFSGNKKQPSDNIIVCIGCNFMTAFRAFKNEFKEHTGVEWAGGESVRSKKGAEYRYVAADSENAEQEKKKSRMEQPPQPSVNGVKKSAGASDQPVALAEGADGSTILGKRKGEYDTATDDGAPSKLRKTGESISTMSQEPAPYYGEAYGFGGANGGTAESFPRAMAEIQGANDAQYEEEAEQFFDFSMGETI